MIDMPCPNCGQQIVEPLSALNADSQLPCSGCGTVLDFKEVERKIKEATEKARFEIANSIKLKF